MGKKSFLMMWAKIYSRNNFLIYHTALLIIFIMLCITSLILICPFFVFFFLFESHLWLTYCKLPGQGWNLNYSCSNTRSLTHCSGLETKLSLLQRQARSLTHCATAGTLSSIYLSYNWKFVPFEHLHPIPRPLTPTSGSHKPDLFVYEFIFEV